MNKRCILTGLSALIAGMVCHAQQSMDLSGTWRFAIDRYDRGIIDQWYLKSLNDCVTLP